MPVRAKLTTLKPRLAVLDMRKGGPIAVERIRGGRLTKIRDRIALRDEYTCQICGRVTAQGEVDHKTPLHLGGVEGSDQNLQYL
jgi:5-methylcytosine-specific restriction protein A